MPTPVLVRVVRECPVVDQSVTLSRERVFLDYVLLSEGRPTCSNIHVCVANHADIKHIPDCLLHSQHFFAADEP